MLWLDRLKKGLAKTAHVLTFKTLDLEAVEEQLLLTDIGVHTVQEIMADLQKNRPQNLSQLTQKLKSALLQKMCVVNQPLMLPKFTPCVILMVGVNGAGKTTTIGKLAQHYQQQKKKIAVVAADTFRAGAVAQLEQWAQRTGADFYAGKSGVDAAGVVFDALHSAQKKKTDIVFIDTAGRLQNRTDLMDELKKIYRVIQKINPAFPQECILVLDATVGQNALLQVQAFHQVCPLTGLIMTKLDGTAKGGILVALADTCHLPVYAIGIGEGVDDLQPFSAEDYVSSLLGDKS